MAALLLQDGWKQEFSAMIVSEGGKTIRRSLHDECQMAG
jgi:hypothetical protein